MTMPEGEERPVALVTGASSGIGFETACRLAERGYDLTLLARREEKLVRAAAELRRDRAECSVVTLAADIADPDAVSRSIAAHEQAHGRLDLIVNAAGVGHAGSLTDSPPTRLQLLVHVNLLGTMWLYRFGAEALEKSARGRSAPSRFVAIASYTGLRPTRKLAAYSATKAAVVALVEAMEAELFEANIRSTAVCPGFVDTPMLEGPWRRRQDLLLPPSDVAEAIMFLLALSPGASVPVLPLFSPKLAEGLRP